MPRVKRHADAVALAAVLTVALGLRLWSIGHGLPFVYNRDEEFHFVPIAIRMFGGSYDPHYFQNPAAFTYLLNAVFRARFTTGFPFGFSDLRRSFLADPGPAVLTARVVVVAFGTTGVWLLHRAGSRFFDRRVGLLAAALTATAFLPVFYSHLALNDVVALVPVTVTLLACLVVYETGSPRAFVLAGIALGTAIGTKYTAVSYVAPLVAAALLAPSPRMRPWRGLAWSAALCIAVFAVLNPFVLIDAAQAARELHSQMTVPAAPGETRTAGPVYYLSTLTWGLGWVPALGALAGVALALRRDRSRGLILAAAPFVLLVLLATGKQLFARWFLPAYPALAILAAYAAVAAVDAVSRLRPARWLRPAALALAALALTAQGLVATVRVDQVLSRGDTRAQAREWLMAHVAAGERVVIEPFVPRAFYGLRGNPRFVRFPVPKRTLAYEGSLRPSLVDSYRRGGFCTVVIGSYQRDRGIEEGYPGAQGYYRRLYAEAVRRAAFSPYHAGARAVAFDYDRSFNFQPRAFWRPGPEIEIWHLRRCRAHTTA